MTRIISYARPAADVTWRDSRTISVWGTESSRDIVGETYRCLADHGWWLARNRRYGRGRCARVDALSKVFKVVCQRVCRELSSRPRSTSVGSGIIERQNTQGAFNLVPVGGSWIEWQDAQRTLHVSQVGRPRVKGQDTQRTFVERRNIQGSSGYCYSYCGCTLVVGIRSGMILWTFVFWGIL